MKTYESAFYARMPRKGEQPLWVTETKAEGALRAQYLACVAAERRGINHPYVITRPKARQR